MKYTVDPERSIRCTVAGCPARSVCSLQWLFYAINAVVIAAFAFACWKLRTLWLAAGAGLALVVCIGRSHLLLLLGLDPRGAAHARQSLAGVPVIGAALASQMLSLQTQFVDDNTPRSLRSTSASRSGLLWFLHEDPRRVAPRNEPFAPAASGLTLGVGYVWEVS